MATFLYTFSPSHSHTFTRTYTHAHIYTTYIYWLLLLRLQCSCFIFIPRTQTKYFIAQLKTKKKKETHSQQLYNRCFIHLLRRNSTRTSFSKSFFQLMEKATVTTSGLCISFATCVCLFSSRSIT